MKPFLLISLRTIFVWGASTAAGVVLTLLVVLVLYMNDKPDLELWHTTMLKEEFSVESSVQTLDEYRALESRLFEEMEQVFGDRPPATKKLVLNRFTQNSQSNPDLWPQNWNRTYEFKADNPQAGILMLHGLSDSPYSLKHLGQRLHDSGAWVVGLRIPGHGTMPSGLVDVQWEDMAAAVKLAMQHMRNSVGDKPLHIVGYSNGAALAVHYALTALADNRLPQPERLTLISPAFGVSPIASLAIWQARLGHLLGMDKLEWLDVMPEYDPYKYQSFTVNAGDVVYRLTRENQRLLTKLSSGDDFKRFPSTLSFLSAVDATVSTRDVVQRFYRRLPPNDHELVVFDLNRYEGLQKLFKNDPKPIIDRLLSEQDLPFTFSVIGNKTVNSRNVVIRSNTERNPENMETEANMEWPEGVFSLSHIGLPFPPNDPLYGGPEAAKSPGISFGDVALRGEKNVLLIPPGDMLRQRWNPFYSVMETKIYERIFSHDAK